MQVIVEQLNQLEQQIAELSREMLSISNRLQNISSQIAEREGRGFGARNQPQLGTAHPGTRQTSYGSRYIQGTPLNPVASPYTGQSGQNIGRERTTGQPIPVNANPASSVHPSSYAPTDFALGSGNDGQFNMVALQSVLHADLSRTAAQGMPVGRQSEFTSYGRL